MESTRLHEISKLIKPGCPIADIGSDHARLPICLVEKEMVPWAIASELGDGPYTRMERTAAARSFGERIVLRQGDGLEVLLPAEVEGVIIAGMGGDLISSILSCDWDKSESFSYYILQPMSKPEVLRKVLAARGWPIDKEILITERGQYHVIVQTRPGWESYQLTDLEQDMGPLILKGDHPLKTGYLNYFLNKYIKVLENLGRSDRIQARELRTSMTLKIRELEAIINAGQG
ncbi:MAG: tRNA (adenine(22)-N(1))-methyltransferase [Deltaproteobacteria bacterium]